MFEILKALRDLNEACRNHGTSMHWTLDSNWTDDLGKITVEIPITQDDVKFTEQMQAMFAPRENENREHP